MKILIVGAWYTSIYEEPLSSGLEKLGHTIYKLKWSKYFKYASTPYPTEEELNQLQKIYYKAQNKLLIGPVLCAINRDLLKLCEDVHPDVVFFYRPTHIRSSTVKTIKALGGIKLVSFHNDDPFAEASLKQNRNYMSSLRFMDWNYVYREKNVRDLRRIGFDSEVLLPYPNTELVYPIPETIKKYDVVFIGHFEDDGRDDKICALLKEESIKFMLFGTNWESSPKYEVIREKLGEIMPVYENDYNKVLNEAKIALCFLSRLNSDKYTRRTFEIPAAGTLLLSEYTSESAQFLISDREAVYFSSTEDFISKVNYYLRNDAERLKVAKNGFEKVINGGHTSIDRARQVEKRLNVLMQND